MVQNIGIRCCLVALCVVLAFSIVGEMASAASTAGSELALVIQTEDGNPINGVPIYLDEAFQGYSDPDGLVTLAQVPAGDHILNVDCFAVHRGYALASLAEVSSTGGVLIESSELDHGKVTLKLKLTASGTVTCYLSMRELAEAELGLLASSPSEAVALPSTEQSTADKIPWAGYWWPLNQGQTALGYYPHGAPGPLAKYDLYVEAKYGGDSRAKEWELANQYMPGAPGWFGHCHAWAAASVLEDEPRSTLNKEGIIFYVGDLKALLTECYYNNMVDLQVGTRFDPTNFPSHPYEDIYPNDFTIILRRWIKDMGAPLVMDYEPGPEVWNHPFYRYDMTFTPSGVPNRVDVTCTVWHVTDGVHPDHLSDVTSASVFTYTYQYWLTVDTGGDIVPGPTASGWYSSRHPDFLWHPAVPVQTNPYLNCQIVGEILGKKVGVGGITRSNNYYTNHSLKIKVPIQQYDPNQQSCQLQWQVRNPAGQIIDLPQQECALTQAQQDFYPNYTIPPSWQQGSYDLKIKVKDGAQQLYSSPWITDAFTVQQGTPTQLEDVENIPSITYTTQGPVDLTIIDKETGQQVGEQQGWSPKKQDVKNPSTVVNQIPQATYFAAMLLGPLVSEVQASPNPTGGAQSVVLTANITVEGGETALMLQGLPQQQQQIESVSAFPNPFNPCAPVNQTTEIVAVGAQGLSPLEVMISREDWFEPVQILQLTEYPVFVTPPIYSFSEYRATWDGKHMLWGAVVPDGEYTLTISGVGGVLATGTVWVNCDAGKQQQQKQTITITCPKETGYTTQVAGQQSGQYTQTITTKVGQQTISQQSTQQQIQQGQKHTSSTQVSTQGGQFTTQQSSINIAPVANAGPYQVVNVNEQVQFAGSGSYDPDGSITSYYWVFDDGATGSGIAPTHTYTQEGTYTVTLFVTDNRGANDADFTNILVVQPGDKLIESLGASPNPFNPCAPANQITEIVAVGAQGLSPLEVMISREGWFEPVQILQLTEYPVFVTPPIYSFSEYRATWDGTHMLWGSIVDDGTYNLTISKWGQLLAAATVTLNCGEWVLDSVSADPDPFNPAVETTTITARGTPGLGTLELMIVREGWWEPIQILSLSEGPSGSYTTTWNGTHMTWGSAVPDGVYILSVSNGTGPELVSGSVTVRSDKPLTSLTANPDPFNPVIGETTLITATGAPGLGPLELWILVEGWWEPVQILPMIEISDGTYTARWDGRHMHGYISPDGEYILSIGDEVGLLIKGTVNVSTAGAEAAGMRVKLTWNTDGTDLDLYLAKPGDSLGSADNCYWNNDYPDWDGDGEHYDPADPANNDTNDPYLDVDDQDGYGPEHITIYDPPAGTYSVGVEYFSDHGQDLPSDATVTVTLFEGTANQIVRTFGPHTMNDYDNYHWYVTNITVPAGTFSSVMQSSPRSAMSWPEKIPEKAGSWSEVEANNSRTIAAAEYFIDAVGDDGTGEPMDPVDGTFDEASEAVTATVNINGLAIGNHTLFAHGRDSAGDWGTFDAVVLKVTEIAEELDTGGGAYPSISGMHNGSITITQDQPIMISKLYTYPCSGTGGHTNSIKLYNESDALITSGTWAGYQGDWHTLTLTPAVTLLAGHTYNYSIVTGSYPQIIHAKTKEIPGGTITCTEFVDTNGVKHTDWIPAIRLF
jgi:PKD repeat protein